MMFFEREQELNSLSQEILIDCETLSMQSSLSQSVDQDSSYGKNDFVKPKIVVPAASAATAEPKSIRGQRKALPKAQQLTLTHALQAPKLAVRSTKTTELRARRTSAASTGSAESMEKLQLASPPLKTENKSRSSSPLTGGGAKDASKQKSSVSPAQTAGKVSGNCFVELSLVLFWVYCKILVTVSKCPTTESYRLQNFR